MGEGKRKKVCPQIRQAQWQSMGKFFHCMNEDGKELFVNLTEDFPVSSQDMAGARKVFRSLVPDRQHLIMRVVNFLFMWFFAFVNCFNGLIAVRNVGKHQEFRSSAGLVLKLGHGSIRLCYDSTLDSAHLSQTFNSTNSHQVDCFIHLPMERLTSWEVLSWAELGMTVVLISSLIWYSLWFICSSDEPSEDGVSNRSKYFRKHPFFFVYAPKMVSGFSLLKLLGFAHWDILQNFGFRGDTLIYTQMFRRTFCGRDVFIQNHQDEDQAPYSLFSKITILLALIVGICVGFQVLLYKLTLVFFIPFTSFYRWSATEWIQVIAFVHQLLAMSNISAVELTRLFLFNFTSEIIQWQISSANSVMAYFCIVGAKLIDNGKLRSEISQTADLASSKNMYTRGVAELAIFATFAAGDLQKLLLDSQRSTKISKFRPERFECTKQLFSQDLADDMNWPEKMKMKSNELCHQLMAKCTHMDERTGETLRLAAMMADIHEELDYASDELSKSDSNTDESDTDDTCTCLKLAQTSSKSSSSESREMVI